MAEPRDPDTPQLSSERQRDLMLAEVLMDSESKTAARQPTPTRGTTWTRIVVAAVLTSVAAWLWIFPPSFLRSPEAPALSETALDAGLRLGMALQAERIWAHRDQVRRLPDQLREVGAVLPGLTYDRRSASVFVLRARRGDSLVEYESTTPLAEFLGTAVEDLGPGS